MINLSILLYLSTQSLLFVGVITNKLNWRTHPALDLQSQNLLLHQPTNLRAIYSGYINPSWIRLQINDFSVALAQYQFT
jgi:hypothetical protein